MTKEKDIVKKWFVCNDQAIITLAKTTNLVNKAIRLHSLTPTTTAVLGRSLTMSVLMSTRLSGKKDNITSIIEGDGPVGKIVCVAKAGCEVKGYVEHPEIDLYPNKNGKLDVSGAVGKNGKLKVVMDYGFGKPYAGEVDLETGEIAEDFVKYYASSLQQPCAIALGVLVAKNNKCESSAGMLIELLPDAEESVIENIEKVVGKIENFSMMMKEKSLDDFINENFSDANFLNFEIEPKFNCKCSKSKLLKILKGMDEKVVSDLFDEKGEILGHCDFCNKTHIITKDDLK